MIIIKTYLYKISQQSDISEEDEEGKRDLPRTRNEYNSISIYDNKPTYEAQDIINKTLEDNQEYEEDDFGYNYSFEEDLEDQEDISENYPEFSSNLDFIEWSTRNSEAINIIYQTKKGIVVVRNVDPHFVFHARTTGNMIVVTFDNTVNEIRSFIINNILQYRFLGRKFKEKFYIR